MNKFIVVLVKADPRGQIWTSFLRASKLNSVWRICSSKPARPILNRREHPNDATVANTVIFFSHILPDGPGVSEPS